MKKRMANQSLPTIGEGVDRKKRFFQKYPAFIAMGLAISPVLGTQLNAAPISPEHAEARDLVQAKKWSEAVVVFRGLLKQNFRSLNLALELADALTQAHRREEALALLQTYWEPEDFSRRKPKSPSSTQEQLQSKIQIISTVFLSQASFQLYQDALSLVFQQKWKLALEKLVKGQDLEPDNTLILVRMGQGLIELSDYDTAAEKLRFAKKLNPLHPDILMWLGRALFFKGELDAARTELETAHRLDPKNERAALWLFELMTSKTISTNVRSRSEASLTIGPEENVSQPEAESMIEAYVKDNPGQMSARLISFRNRLIRSDGDRVKLHALRNDMLKGESLLAAYFQPRSPVSAEFKSPYYLDHRPSIEQVRTELQLLVRDVELKISRLEKRGV